MSHTAHTCRTPRTPLLSSKSRRYHMSYTDPICTTRTTRTGQRTLRTAHQGHYCRVASPEPSSSRPARARPRGLAGLVTPGGDTSLKRLVRSPALGLVARAERSGLIRQPPRERLHRTVNWKTPPLSPPPPTQPPPTTPPRSRPRSRPRYSPCCHLCGHDHHAHQDSDLHVHRHGHARTAPCTGHPRSQNQRGFHPYNLTTPLVVPHTRAKRNNSCTYQCSAKR